MRNLGLQFQEIGSDPPRLSRAQNHTIKMTVCGASPPYCAPFPFQRPDQATSQDARNGGPNIQATRVSSSA